MGAVHTVLKKTFPSDLKAGKEGAFEISHRKRMTCRRKTKFS